MVFCFAQPASDQRDNQCSRNGTIFKRDPRFRGARVSRSLFPRLTPAFLCNAGALAHSAGAMFDGVRRSMRSPSSLFTVLIDIMGGYLDESMILHAHTIHLYTKLKMLTVQKQDAVKEITNL